MRTLYFDSKQSFLLALDGKVYEYVIKKVIFCVIY